MGDHSEYQVEYCGKSSKKSSNIKGGSGTGIHECTKSYDIQPVGGRVQAKFREEAKKRSQTMAQLRATGELDNVANGGLPAADTTFVSTVYSAADRGTHRVGNEWKDPRWTDATRIDSTRLYHPHDRDPANRSNFYVYRSSLVDATQTPSKPMAVPDVHKLRYLQNNYMTGDDWYN